MNLTPTEAIVGAALDAIEAELPPGSFVAIVIEIPEGQMVAVVNNHGVRASEILEHARNHVVQWETVAGKSQ